MKYIKSGNFTTEQLSISETIMETNDVVGIAKDIIEKIINVPDDVKKELDLAINNLNKASDYLKNIKHKTDIALDCVPTDIKEKEFL